MVQKEGKELSEYLAEKVFADDDGIIAEPKAADVKSFEIYMERYKRTLDIERAVVESLD